MNNIYIRHKLLDSFFLKKSKIFLSLGFARVSTQDQNLDLQNYFFLITPLIKTEKSPIYLNFRLIDKDKNIMLKKYSIVIVKTLFVRF